MKNSTLTIAAAALAASVALDAGAWALFGSSASNAAGRLKSADSLLEKAEMAFDEGKLEAASNGFARVLEKYRAIERDYPEFSEGIASIRAKYCEDRLAALVADAGFVPEQAEAHQGGGAAAPDPASAADAFRIANGEPVTHDAAATNSEESAESSYNPRYLQYDFSEARDLVAKGRHADAIDILVPMVKFDPDNRQIRMLLAAARLGAGQPEMAIATLEDLRGRREDLPLLLLISAAYTSAGRYPEALLCLDSAAKLAPGEPDAFSNLAWLTLLMDGNSAEARTVADGYYKQALRRGALKDPALEGAIGTPRQ